MLDEFKNPLLSVSKLNRATCLGARSMKMSGTSPWPVERPSVPVGRHCMGEVGTSVTSCTPVCHRFFGQEIRKAEKVLRLNTGAPFSYNHQAQLLLTNASLGSNSMFNSLLLRNRTSNFFIHRRPKYCSTGVRNINN